MSDALKVINNIRTLRAQARELTLDTLKEYVRKTHYRCRRTS